MSGVRYMYVCAHIGLCLVSVNVKVKRQLLSVILLFCHVGTKNGTHIHRFCGRFLYPVSHLTGSVQFSFHVHVIVQGEIEFVVEMDEIYEYDLR